MSPRPRRPFATLRWGGAVLVAAGLVALCLVDGGQATPARAASTGSGYDQMNGTGDTASAVTVPWTSGLRDSSNQPISGTAGELNPNADRASGTGSYAFMTNGFTGTANGQSYTNDGAFKNLSVTVSQTQDIGHGGITVTWTGGLATNEAQASGGFLQIMECYGNAPTGPSPQDCEFGQGAAPFVQAFNGSHLRWGQLCSSPTLSTTNPTGSMSGGQPNSGCDPFEPAAPTHAACSSGTTDPACADEYSVPFDPADGSTPLYQNGNELAQAFDSFSTNEVDFATSNAAGSGQQQFETLTSAQSSGLGCGQPLADGTPQGCWLVIVPRGVYEPNGYNVLSSSNESAQVVTSSPLSAGNWAQRIQVHLDYAPLPNFCPLGGNARESLMEGSQLVTRAVQSWEVKLNQDANCSRIYHLADTPEQQVTTDFTTPLTPGVPANGLAFTTVPVGEDRVRSGEPIPTLPNMVYAPVAIMGLDFGFHIDMNPFPGKQSGFLGQSVELSPQLLARALTQSYQQDLTDVDPNGSPPDLGPAWAQQNPSNISNDPQFKTLNTEVVPYGAVNSIAPLDTVDHSAYYQQVWNWIQGDASTNAWLDGASNSAVAIDPYYESQQIGKSPDFDSMPRSYPCGDITPVGANGVKKSRCSPDMLPYVADFDAGSADVLTANPLVYGTTWDDTALAPDGSVGYFDKWPVEAPGQIWEWAIDATPYTAAYGLVPATLCDNSGSSCVSPTVASVTAAVNDAKPDSNGLLEVNPASPGAGAYPLTEVIYAAVRTDMPAQALTDYADFISFAAGQGQTPGQAGGDLPAGYLPLTASLQTQATAAVTKLRAIAAGGPTSTGTPTPSSSSSSSASTSAGGSGGSGGTGQGGAGSGQGGTGTTGNNTSSGTSTTPAVAANAGPSSGSTTPATSSSSATPTGPVIEPPTVAIAPAGNTPGQPVGPVRVALAVVVIVGLGGAGAGILLRRGRIPRWPGRWGP